VVIALSRDVPAFRLFRFAGGWKGLQVPRPRVNEPCALVKAVSAALGHSSAATTLGIYSHLWPGDEDRIRDAVDLALARPAEDSLRTERGR
jgi:hypothetical protein